MPETAGKRPNNPLREERLRHNWSQQEVADRIGTTPNNVSRWELGVTTPGPYFRGKLCDLYDKSVQYLGLDSHAAANAKGQAPRSELPIFAGLPALSRSPCNIPYRRNPFFTGRESALARLHALLCAGSRADSTQPQALCGLGGVGKTQLALEYASRYQKCYQAVLWVQADSYELLLSELAVLAELLRLPEASEQDQHKSVKAVKRWLSEQSGWLLILDNVEEVAMLSRVLPTRGHGHLLLTTRSQITGTLAERIELEQMEPQEGAYFLLRRAKLIALDTQWKRIPVALRSDAMAISELLGALPLALDQAGAYIEETACSLSDYLGRYRSCRASLLARRGEPCTDHPESVATTFTPLIGQIERANPAAADLLRLCALLHPAAIPEEVFTEHEEILGPNLQLLVADPLAWDAVMNALLRRSLIQRDAETRTIRIHRLVQVVIREGMDKCAQSLWRERALRVLNSVFPDMDASPTWPRSSRYFPHVHQNTPLEVGEVEAIGDAPTGQQADPLAPFLSARCLFHPRAWCSARDLWRAYQDWTLECGELFPLSRRAFVRYVKAKGAVPARTKTCRIWRRIALSERGREVTRGDIR